MTDLPFWPLMLVAIPANTATAMMPNLVPSCLTEMGFGLSFGGFSTFLFGLGGAAGALFWGWRAHRGGELRTAVTALLLGGPCVFAYLALMPHRHAAGLLFLAGFCGSGAFPTIVALARRAVGPSLGQRMAMIVGGTWAVATGCLLVAGIIAERIGIRPVLHAAWVCYLIAAAAGALVGKRHATANHVADRSARQRDAA